jgi:hypothetical protein
MTTSPEISQSIGPLVDPPAALLNPGIKHIEPILYGDIFDYPPTLEEVWRYNPLPLSREQLSRRLSENEPSNPSAALVGCREGFYHLKGREGLVDLRKQRSLSSRELWKRARRVTSLICNVPFIRSLAVTGSLATDNAGEDGDPDFLVFTASNRIWTVFFFLGTIQRLTSVKTLCPNFYISEDHLQIEPRDFYNAREVVQAIPLVGQELFERFLEANSWVSDYVPNHRRTVHHEEEEPLQRRPVLSLFGRLFEWFAGGRLGDGLEALLRRLLIPRLSTHYRAFGGDAPQSVLEAASEGRELRFHGLHHRTLIRKAIEERVHRLEGRLSQRPLE